MGHLLNKDFLLIAHRGGLFYRPENTLAAFRYCLKKQIEWVELDIRMSADDRPVVIHDDRLHFPDGQTAAVSSCTYEQLCEFDAGGGELIPTLEGVFQEFGEHLKFDLELKELEGADRVIGLVKEMIPPERAFFTSFLPDVLQLARATAPEWGRGLLVDRLAGKLTGCRNAVAAATLLDCEYFLPNFHRLNEEWSDVARTAGLKIIPWTINAPADVKKARSVKVDGLITDCPVDVKTFLKIRKP